MDESSLHFDPPQVFRIPAWLFHLLVVTGLGAPLLALFGLLHYIVWMWR